jgi:hypothetical protein
MKLHLLLGMDPTTTLGSILATLLPVPVPSPMVVILNLKMIRSRAMHPLK